ncbi:uncharacterized protein LOC130656536 [Hydractinia symbiolongicarpus]|uniref:uncharacterized protein LOC130656536 n=1 Tax=Hydractinia symbiolongicarpus TaxID=13093 RepID=UPI00254CC350|nr:uncharacterized protein LOC130656536 [Hydractinia symbiolongicarpus]
MLLYYILFIICQKKLAYADVFISQQNGKDDASCGTLLLPCMSLQYAFTNKVKSTESIKLDSGSTNPYVYVVDKSIHGPNDISVTSYQSNYFRPVIFMLNKETLENHLFVADGKNQMRLHVQNIDFRNTPLLTFNTSCDVIIVNCSFTNTPSAVLRRDKTTTKRSRDTVVIYISYSNFNLSMAMIICCVRDINVVLYKCILQGENSNALYITEIAIKGIVKITNCCISTWKGPVINFGNKCISSINIRNTSFLKTNFAPLKWGLFVYKCLEVFIDKSTFSNYQKSAVVIIKVKKAKITHCNFTKNYGFYGGAIRSRKSNCIINKCVFTFNTADMGGAIYSADKPNAFVHGLTIRQSVFYNNAATIAGGSVYAASRFLVHGILIENSQMHSTSTNDFTTGSIIRSSISINLINVSISITGPLVDIPILEIFNFEESTAKMRQKFLNVSISCPRNYEANNSMTPRRVIFSRCWRCPKGMYSMDKSIITFSGSFKEVNFTTRTSNFTCITCPPGGRCDSKIKSRGHFWGYVNRDNQIHFLPCPSYYCCSRQCESYNDCGKHREGILCGLCKKGFRLNYFSDNCVKSDGCHKTSSWLLYALYSACYVILLMYYKKVFAFLMMAISKYFPNEDQIILFFKKKLIYHRVEDLDYILFQESEEKEEEEKEEEEKEEEKEEEEEEEKEEVKTTEKVKNKTEEPNSDSENKCIASGIKTILYFFYQMEVLIHIPATEQDSYGYLHQLKTTISNIFNLELIQFHISKICFVNNLDAVSKRIIKIGNVFMLFLMLVVAVGLIFFIRQIKRKTKSKSFEHFSQCHGMDKIRNCFIQIVLLGYTGVTTFCFSMLRCVEINNQKHLFIKGDVICYTWWQYCILLIILLWILPFGVSVYLSIKMLQMRKLNLKGFYFSLAFPLASFYYYFHNVYRQTTFNVNREELKKIQDVCEMFTGAFRSNTFGQINWESVVIVRRLLIAAICNFVMNPVARMMLTIPLLLFYLVHHLYVSPYRSKFLNHLETISLSFLLIINVENLFFAFLYMNDQSSVPGINAITNICVWINYIILTAPLLIFVVLAIVAVLRMICVLIWRCVDLMKINM